MRRKTNAVRRCLAAALDEFFEKGFAATRMDDIARRANLSKGALYLYFDSKEAMFHGTR
jgi:AcrR family transcriptional regulator